MAGTPVQVRILGPLEVVNDDGLVALPRGRSRALLVRLAMEPGTSVSTARLVDDLWSGDPPPTATTALHGLVSRLRQVLVGDSDDRDDTVLETTGDGYALALAADQVDAARFLTMSSSAGDLPIEQRAERLREALALWRGPALVDVADEPFAQPRIAELEEARLAALEARVEADLELGRHEALIPELERLVVEHPLRERLLASLMLALERSGRRAEALAAYEDARGRLSDELGIEPSARLRGLARDLRAGTEPDQARTSSTRPSGQPGSTATALEPPLQLVRKVVTVMFAGIVVSHGSEDVPDPEVHRRVVAQAYDEVAAVLDRYGGVVQGFIGDVVVAVFGVPDTREDDPIRAVRAADAIREAARDQRDRHEQTDMGGRWSVGIGINTGEVVIGDPAGTAASGDAVNLAAGLQQAAADGEVLLGDWTAQLVEDVARMEPFEAHRPDGRPIVGRRLRELSQSDRTGAEAPFVGRRSELARLQVALDGTLREEHGRLVVVTGEPGVGKTRLATEFCARLAPDVRVLEGRCPTYGDGLTFRPLREILAAVAHGPEPDHLLRLLAEHLEPGAVDTVAEALGLVEPSSGGGAALFPALRTVFEGLAGAGPVVVVCDDLHWAQPTFLDLLEVLAEELDGPVLFVGLARPELFDDRPHWADQRAGWASMVLEPLGPREARDLVAHLLATQVLSSATVTDVVDRAAGNPFFVEQLLAAVQEGRPSTLPASVQTLLAARFDRLEPRDRDVLRCGAVIGDDVSNAALRALLPEGGAGIEVALRRLVERRLLEVVHRRPGAPTLHRFAHALVRQAAYDSLTHDDRANLHEAYATWLDDAAPPAERDELVGHHLERAHDERRQVGRTDAATRQLAVRAGQRLATAGLRAFGRFDVAAVDRLLSRALRLLPEEHPRRGEALRVLLQAAQVLGRHDEARLALAELLERADEGEVGELPDAAASGDPGLWRLRLRLEQDRLDLFTGPDRASLDEIDHRAAAALRRFVEADDHGGVVDAVYIVGLVRLRRGDWAGMADMAQLGMTHARRSRDPRAEAAMRWWAVMPYVLGPTPVAEAMDRCRELLPWLDTVHAGVLADVGLLQAMAAEPDPGRERLVRARRLFAERFRGRRPLMFVAMRRAGLEVLAGAPDVAEEQLRYALDLARDMGEADPLAEVAGVLSLLLSDQGRVDEAEELATLAARHVPTESVIANARLLAARARVAAARGEADDAVSWARRAVDLVPVDMLNLRADCLVQRAKVLADLGRPEAQSQAASAIELYERKGNVAGAARARALSGMAGAAN